MSDRTDELVVAVVAVTAPKHVEVLDTLKSSKYVVDVDQVLSAAAATVATYQASCRTRS